MRIPPDIKAVIFDMDGLLIDSEPYWRQTTEAFFAKHNKVFSEEGHRYIHGRGLRDIIEYFKREWGFEGDTDALIEERKEMLYEFLLKNLSLMDGAESLIHALDKKIIPMAIATSGHSRQRTKEILGALGVEHGFSVLVSGEDVKQAKPSPDIYLKTAELLTVEPKHCLVFEDAPNGVKAGKAAGMFVVGVNSDVAIAKKLQESGADNVLTSLKQVSTD